MLEKPLSILALNLWAVSDLELSVASEDEAIHLALQVTSLAWATFVEQTAVVTFEV